MSSVPRNSLLHSAAFRLALSYATLFAVSSAILFGVVYWAIHEFERDHIRSSITAEIASLTQADSGLEKLVEQRIASPSHRFQYALIDRAGHRLAGDLTDVPNGLGWQTQVEDDPLQAGAEPHNTWFALVSDLAYVYGVEVGGGQRLFVAEDTESLEGLRETVAGTFALGSAITVALAILGGWLVSLLFVRRLDRINRTAGRIMDGAMAERIPLRGSGDEFDRLSGNLNRMLDRIGSLVSNLKHVSSDIAHDLRTPLSRLRQDLERAKTEAHSVPDYQVVVDRAIEDTDQTLATFSALLRIAEIESGERRAGFATVDLSGLLQRLFETYAPVAEDEGRVLTASITPGITIRGDRDLLTQMIANLCENAIRHTPVGATIKMQLTTDADGVICAVSDNGSGIAHEQSEAVFRPFYRLDQSRSTQGSGLGLAMVAAIAELHGATVTLTDAKPGARFEIHFPRAP